jgi:hypothetical protein
LWRDEFSVFSNDEKYVSLFRHIRMHADGKLFDLPQGKILVLDRAITHDVEAIEESAFLLTVAYPPSEAR